MYKANFVETLQTQGELRAPKLEHVFGENFVFVLMEPEVSSFEQTKHNEYFPVCLKCSIEWNNEWCSL
jgi:hypothetical protein